jgi:hypothetical protein
MQARHPSVIAASPGAATISRAATPVLGAISMPSFSDLLAAIYEYRVLVAAASVAFVVIALVVAWRAGWLAALRRRPRLAGALLVAALIVGLPVTWYLASPLFIRTELVEPPLAAVSPAPASTTAPGSQPDPSSRPDPSAPAASAVTPEPPAVARSGEFQGADDFHFGEGTATLLETAPGAWALRFEDFSVRNGPDLFVYLSPDSDGYADGALEVAVLRATDGSFNVPLPAGVDPAEYRSVLIWCKQFSTLFAVATLEG